MREFDEDCFVKEPDKELETEKPLKLNMLRPKIHNYAVNLKNYKKIFKIHRKVL